MDTTGDFFGKNSACLIWFVVLDSFRLKSPTNVPICNTIVLLAVSFKRYKTLYMEVWCIIHVDLFLKSYSSYLMCFLSSMFAVDTFKGTLPETNIAPENP